MSEKILNEKQIAEIETEIAARDDSTAMESACGEYNCSCHDRLPTLCQTVRVLRAENKRLNAIVSAYENQDEEALEEAENL